MSAALFVCANLLPAAAQAAAQFSAEPLLLNLPAGKRAASLTLGNRGGQPVTVQADLLSWNQDSGEDAYAPDTELRVSPPIFSLAPAAVQVVRVGRLKLGAAPVREIAYRLKLAEVPDASALKLGAVTTIMQLTFPVFVPPADRKAAPKLEASATVLNDGLVVDIVNSGLVHGKLTALRTVQEGAVLHERALNYYVLAGARRQLPWPEALKLAKPGAVQLQLQLEGRNRTITLPLTLAP